MMEPTECRWVAPLDEEDREYFSYFRTVCKRYDIVPSRATRLEYDFVTRVAESCDLMKWLSPMPASQSCGHGDFYFIRRRS